MRRWIEFGEAKLDSIEKFKDWMWKMLEKPDGEVSPAWFSNVLGSVDAVIQLNWDLAKKKTKAVFEVHLSEEEKKPRVEVSLYDEEMQEPFGVFVIPLNFYDMVATRNFICFYEKE